MITLITGGARSGKTRHALISAGAGEPKIYIATAEILDDEMRERVALHQAERGIEWHTIEEPLELGKHLKQARGVVVIDCLTLLLSNWLLRDESSVKERIERFCAAIRETQADIVAITNEVGSSIVPENALARSFRDHAGWMNQRVAELADRVFLMVCGVAVPVK